MEELKEIITCALDNRGVLSRLKAELRANVFLAVDEQDRRQKSDTGIAARSNSSKRDALAGTHDGLLLLDLVQEFLAWADLRFTAKVFEAEAGREGGPPQRQRLAAELGLSGADDGSEAPLLMQVLVQMRAARQLARALPPASPWQPAHHHAGSEGDGDGPASQRAGPLVGPTLPPGVLAADGVAGGYSAPGAGRQSGGGDVSLLRLISGATLSTGVSSFEEAPRTRSQEPLDEHAEKESGSPGGASPTVLPWTQHGPLPAAGSDGEGPGGSPAASAELPLLPGLNAAPPVATDGSEAGGESGERSDSGGSDLRGGAEEEEEGSIATTHRLLSPGASIASASSPFPGNAWLGSAPSSDAGSPARLRPVGRLAPLPAARLPMRGGAEAEGGSGSDEGGEDLASLDLRRFRGAAAGRLQQQQPARRAEAAAHEPAEGFASEDEAGTATAEEWSPSPQAAGAAAWGDSDADASPAVPRPVGAHPGAAWSELGGGAAAAAATAAAAQPARPHPGASYAIEELLDEEEGTEELPEELPAGYQGLDASGNESSQLFAVEPGAWGASPGSLGLQSPGASSEEGPATLLRPPPALGEDGSDGF